MHEFSLIKDLFNKIEDISKKENASQVTKVRVKLGSESHLSADHFIEHFVHAAQGTKSEKAILEIREVEGKEDTHPTGIALESIDVI